MRQLAGRWWLGLVLVAAQGTSARADRPIALHPDNPHYFLFRGRPTVLITSGEHYGAVLNADFNAAPYLDELQARGFNLTRTFTGIYAEQPGAFNIARNTLAPAPGRLLCPWARGGEPGYANGGNKFDLTKWDEAYFKRLREFVAQAGKRGVVVELSLFCPYYEEGMWALAPLNARNNVNGVGKVARTDVYALKDKQLQAVQEALVRKVLGELKEFDNVYYEVCNEPYFGGVTEAWQRRIIEVILDAEKELPHRHLIAQNIANGSRKVADPHPAVSLFNFHYAAPPDAVAQNFQLNRAIGDDETGFKGTGEGVYRREGWEFILAGGGLYDNLDYSFTVGHEDGTFRFPPTQPGSGGPALRKQLQVLKEFIHGLDFLKMRPDSSVLVGKLPAGLAARALIEHGKQYAVYLHGGKVTELILDLPAGRYQAEWVNTLTGSVDRRQEIEHRGGRAALQAPPYHEDVALRIVAKKGT